MKAIILAAGKGTRMRPLTYLRPKPMISLVDTPVLETIIKHLVAGGVEEIVINTAYMGDSLQSYFGDGRALGANIAYSFEGYIEDGKMHGEALGSAGGIKRIQEFSGFFDEPFLVLCGDAYIDFDISAFAAFHRAKGAMASLLTQEVPIEEVTSYGVVATDEQGQVVQFQEKPLVEEAVSNCVNTGIYLFEPEVIDHIPINQIYDIGGELFPYMAANNLPLYATNQDFTWLDIGQLPDFFTCQATLLNGEVPGFELPGKEVSPGVRIGSNVRINLDKVSLGAGVYIANSCHIEDGVTIEGPCIIGANCHVGKDAQLSNVFIGQYTRIPRGTELADLIIDSPYVIDTSGNACTLAEHGVGIGDARAANEQSVVTIPALANVPLEDTRNSLQL